MLSELPPSREPHIPLHAEELSVSRRQTAGDTLQVSPATREHERFVDEMLNHERGEIERETMGRPVDAIPAIRQEGDTTIMSVVEEAIVVERRLILKEEVRIRRLRVSERHQETVVLLKQEAVITRVEPLGADVASERREK